MTLSISNSLAVMSEGSNCLNTASDASKFNVGGPASVWLGSSLWPVSNASQGGCSLTGGGSAGEADMPNGASGLSADAKGIVPPSRVVICESGMPPCC